MMYENALQSEGPVADHPDQDALASEHPPHYVRARGMITLKTALRDGQSVREHVREEGSLRIRFPRERCGALMGVIVNTGGGMTGGDQFSIEAQASRDTRLTLTTSAAEKFYRSTGEMAIVNITLSAQEKSRLIYLPQEAIIFNEARVERHVNVRLAESASALLCDMTCIGRTAMEENVGMMELRDRWQIWIGGELELADFTALSGPADNILARSNVAAGASCIGTLYHAGENLHETAAAWNTAFADAGPGIQAAAGVTGRVAMARMVSSSAQVMRTVMAECFLRAGLASLPRSWAT